MSDVDDYLTQIRLREARWRTVRDWLFIISAGTFVIACVIVFIGLLIQQQERKAACERQGYTWIETEYSAKCIAVKEVK